MRIGLDIDSVVCESMPVILAEVERVTGIHFEKSYITEYDQIVGNFSLGLIIRDLYKQRPSVLHDMEPVVGAVEGIAKLAENHEIIFITSRHNATIPVTEAWIRHHFGKYPIFHTGPSEDKCNNEIDLLIDDGPKFAVEFASRGHDVLLFDQPWNQDVKDTRYITRVKSWDDILRLIG